MIRKLKMKARKKTFKVQISTKSQENFPRFDSKLTCTYRCNFYSHYMIYLSTQIMPRTRKFQGTRLISDMDYTLLDIFLGDYKAM